MEVRTESISVGDDGCSGTQEPRTRLDGDQLTRFHESNAIAEQQGFAQIVSDENNRFPQPFLQLHKFSLQLRAGDRIQRTEGLVHQQNRRIGGQSPGDANTLSLSAGKFARVARYDLGIKPDQPQQFLHAFFNSRGGPVFNLGTKPIFRSTVK